MINTRELRVGSYVLVDDIVRRVRSIKHDESATRIPYISFENNNRFEDEAANSERLAAIAQKINAHIAPDARIFEYPGLDNVYIMEGDLYGNTMPDGSCFPASLGNHGLIGRHLKI
jgi:hypothetical protein